MTQQEKIYSLISKAELSGVRLSVSESGRVKVSPEHVPVELLNELRSNKDEILAYLVSSPRPEPDLVAFVAKNLDVLEWPKNVVNGVQTFWLGERPYWRLSPVVAAWIERKVADLESSARKAGKSLDWLPSAVGLVGKLWDYCTRHFRPHEIWAARQSRGPLPEAEEVPFTVPDWQPKRLPNVTGDASNPGPTRAVHAQGRGAVS